MARIKRTKNKVVKSQKFEEAASLRDEEKKIEESLFKQIFAKKEDFINLLKSNEETIIEDYCILSTLTDITPIYDKGRAREYLDTNFINLYFNKLSKDLEFLSPYRFGDIYSKFQSEIFPICQNKIFYPQREKESEPLEVDDEIYSSFLYKPKEEPRILGLEPHKLRVRPKEKPSGRSQRYKR
ncbi:MAG: UvrB/UvrC motif-containing protein [Chitinophagaceae bacterium]|nr:UvrB/UvrC motif-containing protein [Chitinophagaceae bacterium]